MILRKTSLKNVETEKPHSHFPDISAADDAILTALLAIMLIASFSTLSSSAEYIAVQISSASAYLTSTSTYPIHVSEVLSYSQKASLAVPTCKKSVCAVLNHK